MKKEQNAFRSRPCPGSCGQKKHYSVSRTGNIPLSVSIPSGISQRRPHSRNSTRPGHWACRELCRRSCCATGRRVATGRFLRAAGALLKSGGLSWSAERRDRAFSEVRISEAGGKGIQHRRSHERETCRSEAPQLAEVGLRRLLHTLVPASDHAGTSVLKDPPSSKRNTSPTPNPQTVISTPLHPTPHRIPHPTFQSPSRGTSGRRRSTGTCCPERERERERESERWRDRV